MRPIRLPMVSVVSLCMVLGGFCAGLMAEEPAGRVSNVLVGRIFAKDGTTPLAKAVVKAYHMESGRVFSSEPSRQTGSYSLTGLPNGSYDIAVETPEGSFIAEEIVRLSGGVRVLMSFTLSAEALPTKVERRLEHRGLEGEEAMGLAKLLRKREGEPVWNKSGGVASIVLGSIAAGIVVDEVFEEDEATPSTP